MSEVDPSRKDAHRTFAKALFNRTWELIGQASRTPGEDAEMIHAAHASRYHWHVLVAAGEGTALNEVRGDWLLARVYALVGQPLQALQYAERSLRASEERDLGAFDRAFGHEAVARAAAVARDAVRAQTHLDLARSLAPDIAEAKSRAWLLDNLATIVLPA